MAPSSPFQDTDETRTALMQATYDALCKHGYAGLTIQRIGDEFPKSKSLIYQHYDGKDELLVAFLGFMIEHFESEVPIDDSDNASDQLQAHLDHLLASTLDEERYEFMSAMTELRAQAPHNEAYRERFTKTDQIFHSHLTDVLRTGIENGEFRAVDPEQTAELLLTVINGAMLRRMTTDDSPDLQAVRTELDEYIRSRLLSEDNGSG
jgi:AcrR family transcriptional regulator